MIVLMGKTTAGKDTIRKELNKLGIDSVITYTTRKERNGEVDGVDYNFLSEKDFFKKKDSGWFVETTSYNTISGTVYYGSAFKDLSDNKIIIINPSGVHFLKKLKSIKPVIFYLMVSEETIWNRLRKRGDNSEEARRRLTADNQDFSKIDQYVDFVIRNEYIKPELVADMIKYTYNKISRN